MASITLKNVPDELMQELREAAQGERRSLNQEMLHLLVAALGARGRQEADQPAQAQARVQVAAWRALAGAWRADEDEATQIKRLYSRRTLGRKAKL